MDEEDIRKQLKEKNKEIYLNKLNLDLTNNLEVLVLTIDNLLNNISRDTINKILGITESFQNQNIIETSISKFIEEYRTFLMNLIDIKKENIETFYKETNDLKNFKDKIKELNDNLKEKLNNNFNTNINKLIKEITNLYEDEFCNLRISEYLKNIFKENLNNKVMDTINSRDLILLNTFNETYLKYLDLNKNTIGGE